MFSRIFPGFEMYSKKPRITDEFVSYMYLHLQNNPASSAPQIKKTQAGTDWIYYHF